MAPVANCSTGKGSNAAMSVVRFMMSVVNAVVLTIVVVVVIAHVVAVAIVVVIAVFVIAVVVIVFISMNDVSSS
jgi:hypothetical protein